MVPWTINQTSKITEDLAKNYILYFFVLIVKLKSWLDPLQIQQNHLLKFLYKDFSESTRSQNLEANVCQGKTFDTLITVT